MWLVGAGLILNLAACIAVFSNLLHHGGAQPAANFFATFLVLWAFLIIGFILMLARKFKSGALLLAIGSLVLAVASVMLLPVGALVALAVIAAIVTIAGAVRIAIQRAASRAF